MDSSHLRTQIDSIKSKIADSERKLAIIKHRDDSKSKYMLSEAQIKEIYELGMELRAKK